MGKKSKSKAKPRYKLHWKGDDDNRHSKNLAPNSNTKNVVNDIMIPTQTPAVNLPQAFPSHLPVPSDGFLRADTPDYKESFRAALEGPYEGFVVDHDVLSQCKSCGDDKTSPPPSLDDTTVEMALQGMLDDSYFRTDVTQPFGLGTKCAKTYVTRCLVGAPGTTYKYLGLRMFSHPWEDQTANTGNNIFNINNDSDNPNATIRRLGQTLTERTQSHLQALTDKRRKRGAPPTRGRADFDICLINRMELRADLKPEPTYNDDEMKTSVSWHADSSLENFSTIAVYQTVVSSETRKHNGTKSDDEEDEHDDDDNTPWLVALRVAHHSEGPTQSFRRGTNIESAIVKDTPPIALSLPSGSAYYLLDDFNHHHQHTVLSSLPQSKDTTDTSAAVRYSCTFRLLRDSHNVQDWITRGKTACGQFHKKGSKLWRSEQLLLTEIESEWLRQFFIQGVKHYELLWETYWKQPMQELLKIWSQLERRTFQTIELLRYAAQGNCGVGTACNDGSASKAERKARERRKRALTSVQELLSRAHQHSDDQDEMAVSDFYQPLAQLLDERAGVRDMWIKREKDHVFREMPKYCRPMEVPFKFGRPLDQKIPENYGSSPLPGSPVELRRIALDLRAYGEAYQSRDASRLPSSSSAIVPKQQAEEPLDNAKSLHWSGWREHEFGLELQQPWAGAVVDGTKAIETRQYALPPSLEGKKIMIIESPTGTAGVSSLGNELDFSNAKVIGWCRFKSVKRYETAEEFEEDESLHLVSPGSGYGWKRGATKIVYGWVVGECGRINSFCCDDEVYTSAVRRMRSLFELLRQTNQADHGKTTSKSNLKNKHSKRNSKTESESGNEGKKKRKRF